MSPLRKAAKRTLTPEEVERNAVRELVKAVRARGYDLTGPEGLLKVITKQVIEAALEEEMSEHVGYDRHAVEGRNGGNSRNGTRVKTVLTDNVGPVEIDVLRDRDGSFEPVIVKKRQRRVTDVDAIVLSLYARGLTTGQISAHFAEIYGVSVSKDTVSRITDKVIEDMQAWSSRPLQRVYAAIFIDAIMVKVRDGQVGNQPFYAAIGVDLAGHRDVLGLWAGNGGGESARFWLGVLTELKNRGVADVFFIVSDGLKVLPDSVNGVVPEAIVQTSSVHHEGGGMVPLVVCAVTDRTYANVLPARSTCSPVRPWRGRPGSLASGSCTLECRDEVPGPVQPRQRWQATNAARGAAWSHRYRRGSSLASTGAAPNTSCVLSTPSGKPSSSNGSSTPVTGSPASTRS